jgi:hypothetical protein
VLQLQSNSWFFPWQLLVLMIAVQREEAKGLREMLGGKRLRSTDPEDSGDYSPGSEPRRRILRTRSSPP